MKNKVKNYLKTLDKYKIKEIVKHPDLSEIEKWLIYYTLRPCAKPAYITCSPYFAQNAYGYGYGCGCGNFA